MYLDPKKKSGHVDLFEDDSFGDFQEGEEDFDFQPNSKVIRKKQKPFAINALNKKKAQKVIQEDNNDISDVKKIYKVNFFGDRLQTPKKSQKGKKPKIQKTQEEEKIQSKSRDEETMQELKRENQEEHEQQQRKHGRNRDDWRQMDRMFINIYEGKEEASERQIQERKEREQKIQRAKQLLSGKVSSVWIFIMRNPDPEDVQKIKTMYNGLLDKFLVPICRNAEEAKPFLDLPHSFFKIVADLANMENALNFRIKSSVTEFYVYNEKGDDGVAEAIDFKSRSKKVKGIYTKLNKILNHAGEEMQNQVKIYQTKKGQIKMRKCDVKFPSFLKLSGEDKSEATRYRGNLYGARKLLENEKGEYLFEFLSLVKEKYLDTEDSSKQKKNFEDYKEINHKIQIQTKEQASQILNFYVRQSFYYKILNSMLRTLKTTEQFKPCVLPFNQTYNAIKIYYSEKRERLNRKIPACTLYRGARMRKMDFQSLKKGSYIQMFGFMSTSKNFQRAKEFADQAGYMFIIHVPDFQIPPEFDKYDHGFVDINENNLAPPKLQREEEVLFNALNVYKVKEITEDREGITRIHIQYGVIFKLLLMEKQKLTEDEKSVLINYEYCTRMLEQIQDRGDVHLLANEFDEAKKYYQKKLQSDYSGVTLCKLANIHQQCGQLEEAGKRAEESLKIQMQSLEEFTREKCMRVYEVHIKNAEIKEEDENIVDAEDEIKKAINYLEEDDDFIRAQKYRQMGELKFKRGQIKQAEEDFERCQKLLNKILNKAQEKRKQLDRKYCCCTALVAIFSSKSKDQIEKQKQNDYQILNQIEEEIESKKKQIHEQLVKVNRSMKEVANFVEDQDKYEECVKKAQQYLEKIQQQTKTQDPHQQAKLQVLNATVKNFQNIKESQELVQSAIKIEESLNPFNEEVGEYTVILANFQKEDLEKWTNPKGLMKSTIEKEKQIIEYKKEEHEEVYKTCKKNYQKAINVMLYNNKTNASPEVMTVKNHIGQLDFNESKYESSYKITKDVTAVGGENYYHTEISKSHLILAKIAYSRGEQKNAFETIKKAKDILRKSIVKRQEAKYLNAYRVSEIYLQIKMQRANIYLKQLNHEMCLKDINEVKTILSSKLDTQSHSILADIYELQAQNAAMNFELYEFDEFFSLAISLRENQIGFYNLPNAISYCNYAKYLIMFKDFKKARTCLEKAVQIFSCFSDQHPIKWLLIYCYGILTSAKDDGKQKALEFFEKCIHQIESQFDKSHITYTKIKLHYARQLRESGKYVESIKELRNLKDTLEDNIRASQNRSAINFQEDDEKVTVKKMLYSSLKESYRQIQDLKESKNLIQDCERELNNLKNSFRLSD